MYLFPSLRLPRRVAPRNAGLRIGPGAKVIRPPVRNRVGHAGGQRLRVIKAAGVPQQKSCKSTHYLFNL